MQFDNNGNLYPFEIFEIDIPTFELFFVTKFGHSKTRRKLFIEYQNYLIELYKIINSNFEQWINGSFVTEKLHPNDIDIVTFIDYKIYDEKYEVLQQLFANNENDFKNIDAYFVKAYPIEHQNYYITQFDFTEWNYLFSKNKKKENKGFLKIKF